MMDQIIVADIGGTNARFALAHTDIAGYSNEITYQCADFPTADSAIEAYIEQAGAAQPAIICIAAAGPIADDKVLFTNNNWHIDGKRLSHHFGGARVRLLNDFEANAYALPELQETESFRIGHLPVTRLDKAEFTVAVIGPGTGLGAAGLCKKNGRVFALIGEAGHVGFAPETQLQMDILAELRKEFDRVSDERLVSGQGAVNIYRALARIRNEEIGATSPREVFSLAASDKNGTAMEAVQVFFEILGQVAGNFALSIGATDGVYIGGGIVTRDPGLMAGSRFRAGFERKGRHRQLMEKIPTQVVLHQQPGLLGASHFALKMRNGE